MAKTYEPVNWKNKSTGKTPVNATNLKHMDDAIKDLYDGGASTTDIVISSEEPTVEDWKLWIDSDEVQNSGSEIVNEYSESTKVGYSADYINKLHTYSTDEVRIGTWIDRKPLYRKVVNMGNMENNDLKMVAHGIANMEFGRVVDVCLQRGTNQSASNFQCFSVGNVGGTYNNVKIGFDTYLNSSTINVYCNGDRTAYVGYAIIEYTKTTD